MIRFPLLLATVGILATAGILAAAGILGSIGVSVDVPIDVSVHVNIHAPAAPIAVVGEHGTPRHPDTETDERCGNGISWRWIIDSRWI